MSDQEENTAPAGETQSSSPLSPSNPQTTTTSSAQKRSRGRPRKYHTEAEREEAKRRYRENHKSKATGGGGGGGASTTPSATTTTTNAGVSSNAGGLGDAATPKQHDIDELWAAIHTLQAQLVDLKQQVKGRDAGVNASATPAAKRRKT